MHDWNRQQKAISLYALDHIQPMVVDKKLEASQVGILNGRSTHIITFLAESFNW